MAHAAASRIVPADVSRPSFLREVQDIVERACTFTAASSAAFARVDGDELLTEVSVGQAAPDPGARSSIVGSFTGSCVTSAKLQRCDDTELDTRVDRDACRELRIRSIVAVPISVAGEVAGVLVIFSAVSQAFTATHVAVLKTLSDVLSEALRRHLSGGHATAQHAAAGNVDVRKAPSSEINDFDPRELRSTADSELLPLAAGVDAAKPARDKNLDSPAFAPARSASHHASNHGALETAKAASKPNDSGKLRAASESAKFRTDVIFTGIAAQPPHVHSHHRLGWISASAALAITLSVGGWLVLRPADLEAMPSVRSVPPSPQQMVSMMAPQTMVVSAASPDAVQPPAGDGKPSPQIAEETVASEQHAAADRAVLAKPVKLSSDGGRKGQQQIEAPSAPELAFAASIGAPALNLARPTVDLAPQPKVIIPSAIVKRVVPLYPQIARNAGVQGTVVASVSIDANGRVTNVRIVNGEPMLREAAVSAIKQWVYRPATLDGVPVESSSTAAVQFNLGRR